MRISDWSSDVCSSDLERDPQLAHALLRHLDVAVARDRPALVDALDGDADLAVELGADRLDRGDQRLRCGDAHRGGRHRHPDAVAWRSEARRVGKEGVSTCRSRWTP